MTYNSGVQQDRRVIYGVSRLTELDIYLFREGTHDSLYEKLGAHSHVHDGVTGTLFSVWAPNARAVSVIGDFNGWNPESDPLGVRWDSSGIWEGFVPGLARGEIYKFHVVSSSSGYRVDKGDPFAFHCETPPRTGSRVWPLEYQWGDSGWMQSRARNNSLHAPISIYEVHLGSWRRVPDEGNRFLSYPELAHQLAPYVKDLGFTHVELMPITEHPFYGSWGYQTTGYFAPTSRFGTPQDFMYFVDYLHQNGIGVILDWVPSHFPSDQHGLSYFDGSHLFEHADLRQGFHPDWNSLVFNYGRKEVAAFLLSSAMFWLEKYHIDGLRVDAVASMLYLDYSRKDGEWIPNPYGGRENLEAIDFLRQLNSAVYRKHPDVQMYAEESTAWPMVSRPVHLGGLGFGLKWNMGWMHDTLVYMSKEPIHRKHHHDQLTFSIWYAFFENFILPLSHDEVVHGKGSLLGKMPGDTWQKRANLRLLYGHLFTHPGKKLLFMGGEFGQWGEWNHEESLPWHLLEFPDHQEIQRWVRDLAVLYRSEPCLHADEFSPTTFRWIDCADWEQSVVSFLRMNPATGESMLVVSNFTPVPRENYRIGVPSAGSWRCVLNSDAHFYGGSGAGGGTQFESQDGQTHGYASYLVITLPPLGMLVLKPA